MNIDRAKILKSAVCYWSTEDACFVMESPAWEMLVAAADTEAETRRLFETHLDDYITEALAGRLAPQSRPGRPLKGLESVGYRVKPEIKEAIADLAETLGTTQGEAVHFLFLTYLRATNRQPVKGKKTIKPNEVASGATFKKTSAKKKSGLSRRSDQCGESAKHGGLRCCQIHARSKSKKPKKRG